MGWNRRCDAEEEETINLLASIIDVFEWRIALVALMLIVVVRKGGGERRSKQLEQTN